MALKKATSAAPAKKAAAAPQHASYRDMIKEAILALKERNGSSRSALKKYILANNKNIAQGPTFDTQFNRAIKAGVEKGEFAQPKGTSGTVKLAKKDASAAPAAKKPAAAKKAAATKTKTPTKPKTTTTKTVAPKKTATTKAKPGPKKATTATKKTAAKPKANTGTKRKAKTPAAAPAIVEEKKVLGKTKSGRVTKGPAKPTNPAKKTTAATKKAPKAKSTPKKTAATPKKDTPAAT
ncbi:hypothetical protein JMJ35_000076 [Cladonia borealis]|uniref:Histone H1 n=1 Tax=Cladonia borealis TaxID=184061 RepID=A0AA39RAW6_9LECA|nr:hypothetical protein JMJ35_000076 [Cladonia borealis]